MNEEGILVALGYNSDEVTMTQLRRILSHCDFEQNELERIVGLNDKLKMYGGYIAMSNSEDVFKIKNDSPNPKFKEAVREIIFAWSEKFKLRLRKVEGKDTYYITGRY